MSERLNPFRVGSQNYRLLERLWKHPIWNIEAIDKMRILRLAARIGDLKRKGFKIESFKHRTHRGWYGYRLEW